MCMYIRKSSSTRNGKTYTTAQIVEGYRNEEGQTLFICFLALQMTVFFELRLKPLKMTFEKAKGKLRQMHVVNWKSGHSKHKPLTSATAEQLDIFKNLEVPKPTTKSFVVSDF